MLLLANHGEAGLFLEESHRYTLGQSYVLIAKNMQSEKGRVSVLVLEATLPVCSKRLERMCESRVWS